MVAMVDRKLLYILRNKFTQAASTYPRIEPECLLAIVPIADLAIATSVGDDSVKFVFVNVIFHRELSPGRLAIVHVAVERAYGARLVPLVKIVASSDSQHRPGGMSSEDTSSAFVAILT